MSARCGKCWKRWQPIRQTENIHCWRNTNQNDRIIYLVTTADKGLAGAYTSNLLREAVAHMSATGYAGLVTTGRKGRDYFRRRGYTLTDSVIGISERPKWEDAVKVASELIAGYVKGDYDQVYVVYTRFYSPMNQKPMTVKLLPLEIPGVAFGEEEDSIVDTTVGSDYIVEPSPADVIESFVATLCGSSGL